jgi:DtxR family Mn-dependent transcriptional regulator
LVVKEKTEEQTLLTVDLQIMCITDIKEGQRGTIVSILGGRRATKRLADLGLTPGTEFKVLRKIQRYGPIEIEVRGSNIVLGRGIALKIQIVSK